MKIIIQIFILGAILLAPLTTHASPPPLRTWTSKKGTQVKATLDRVHGYWVILTKPDGTKVKIRRTALSIKDLQYLALLEHNSSPQKPVFLGEYVKHLRTKTSKPTAFLRSSDEPNDEPEAVGQIRDHQGQVIQDDAGLNRNNLFQNPAEMPNHPNHNIHNQPIMNDPIINDPLMLEADNNQIQPQQWQQRQREWEQQQAEREAEEQKWDQRQREREKQEHLRIERDIKQRAFQLEADIENSGYKAYRDSRLWWDPNYGGMASESESLSQDASRLGASAAAWDFGNAATTLQEMETEWNRRQDNFLTPLDDLIHEPSPLDDLRDKAGTDVWSGEGSIEDF